MQHTARPPPALLGSMNQSAPFFLGTWLPACDDDEALVLRELFGTSVSPCTDLPDLLPDPSAWPSGPAAEPSAWPTPGWDAHGLTEYLQADPLPADLRIASWLASVPPAEAEADGAPSTSEWPLSSLLCLDYLPAPVPVPPVPAADWAALLNAYAGSADALGLDWLGPWTTEGGAT